jgi:hypothetical protein
VLFTDEKTFTLFGTPNRSTDVVWEETASAVPPVPRVKHPQKLHVWAGMSYYGKVKPYFFRETLDKSLYMKILSTRLPGKSTPVSSFNHNNTK